MKEKKTLGNYLTNIKDYISNIPRRVKTAIAAGTLLGIVSTVASPPAHAQEVYSKSNEDGWKIEATVDFVPGFAQVQGLEEKMGASGKVYDEWSEDYFFDDSNYENWREKWEFNRDYGAELNLIEVNPGVGSKILIKPKVSLYTPSNVGFHIEGWQLSGSDSKSEEVPGIEFFGNQEFSSYPGLYPDQEEGELSSGIVSMWDQIFYSYWSETNHTYNQETHDSTYYYYPEKAKTKYECSRDFKLLNGNLFVSIPLVPSLHVLGGLKGQFFEINDMQKVQPTFYSEVHETSNQVDGFRSSYDEFFHNNVDLEVNSSIKGKGLGPMVGLMSSKNITDWLRVYGDFSKSWIRLKTERTANFSDLDDISQNYVSAYYDSEENLVYEDTGEGTTYLEGKIPFTVEQTHNLSQTELNLGLEFLLEKHVTLSVGYWKNIMQSLPKPAKFHYIIYNGFDDPNLNKHWEYEVEAKDISAQGFKINVGVRF